MRQGEAVFVDSGAWIALALAAQASIDEATWLANAAAAVGVGKRGTATVSPDEVLELIRAG